MSRSTTTRPRPTRCARPGLLIAIVVALVAAIGLQLSPIAAAPAAAATTDAGFVPLTPVRVLDTRTGVGGTNGPVGPVTTITLPVAGLVAPGTRAVVLNVTSTRATAPSFVTVWGEGDRPPTSNLNLDPGQDTPNLVISTIGGDGAVRLYNHAGQVELIADLVGYLTDNNIGTNVRTIEPTRILDTRRGVGATAGPVAGGESIEVQVTSPQGIPPHATAVFVNVTSTQATQAGYVTVFPGGNTRPTASSLNHEVGQDTPNLVLVALGPGGTIQLFNSHGTAHLVADVMAWVDLDPVGLTAASPHRVLDTRNGTGTRVGTLGPDEAITVQMAGVGPIPDDATAVVVNLTSTRSTSRSFITAWPSGEDMPLASSLNTEPGQDTPNLAIVKLGDDGAIRLYNKAGTTHVIADVAGWFVDPTVFQSLRVNWRGYRSAADAFPNRLTVVQADLNTLVLEALTHVGAFAIGEDFVGRASFFSHVFQLRTRARLHVGLDYWGTTWASLGTSAAAHARVVVRLRQTSGVGAGSVVWDWVALDDGVGAGLEGVEVKELRGNGRWVLDLPPLDMNTNYDLEIELECHTKASFSPGVTECDFYGGDRQLRVTDWYLEYPA